MSKFQRSPTQRRADLALIGEFYRKGWSQQQITDALNERNPYKLVPSTIHRDIKKIEELWRSEAIKSMDIAKAKEIYKINRLEAEAWDRFEASKKERKKRTVIAVPGGQGGTTLKETQVTTEESDGDPRWLDIIDRCVDRRAKILGLYAPTRSEVGGIQGGAPIKVSDLGIDPEHAYRVLYEEISLKVLAGEQKPPEIAASGDSKNGDVL